MFLTTSIVRQNRFYFMKSMWITSRDTLYFKGLVERNTITQIVKTRMKNHTSKVVKNL